MAAYNPRNNGSTAHLFGTTAKLPQMSRLSQPRPAELSPMARPRTETAQPVQAPTFAQMQQQGQARPPAPVPTASPTTTAPAAMMAPEATASTVPPVFSYLYGQLPMPPQGNPAEVYNRLREARRAELEAEFGARRQMLDEEMARRGIYSSSIAAGRMGDLEGQQARALASMDADLLRGQFEAERDARLERNQMLIALGQILQGMDPRQRAAFLEQLRNLQGQLGNDSSGAGSLIPGPIFAPPATGG